MKVIRSDVPDKFCVCLCVLGFFTSTAIRVDKWKKFFFLNVFNAFSFSFRMAKCHLTRVVRRKKKTYTDFHHIFHTAHERTRHRKWRKITNKLSQQRTEQEINFKTTPRHQHDKINGTRQGERVRQRERESVREKKWTICAINHFHHQHLRVYNKFPFIFLSFSVVFAWRKRKVSWVAALFILLFFFCFSFSLSLSPAHHIRRQKCQLECDACVLFGYASDFKYRFPVLFVKQFWLMMMMTCIVVAVVSIVCSFSNDFYKDVTQCYQKNTALDALFDIEKKNKIENFLFSYLCFALLFWVFTRTSNPKRDKHTRRDASFT